jgi:hypothetical protein
MYENTPQNQFVYQQPQQPQVQQQVQQPVLQQPPVQQKYQQAPKPMPVVPNQQYNNQHNEKDKNGIFEGKRDKSLPKYIIKIPNKDLNKFEIFLSSIGFNKEGQYYILIIE